MGDDTVIHTGNQKITTTGQIDESHVGDKMVTDTGTTHNGIGAWSNNYLATYSNLVMGASVDAFLGGKIETHHGPLLQTKQGEFGKNELKIEDIKSLKMDKSMTIIQKASLIMWG